MFEYNGNDIRIARRIGQSDSRERSAYPQVPVFICIGSPPAHLSLIL